MPVDQETTARDGDTPDDLGSVQYAQHTALGTLAAARGTITWRLEWIAPSDADAPVTIHVAANASNDDESPLGDYIYTAEIEVGRPSR
jgi:hypothetical protein